MAADESQKQDSDKIEADGDEPDVNCLDKFLIREPFDCFEKARGYSKHPQGNLTRGQEEIQNPTDSTQVNTNSIARSRGQQCVMGGKVFAPGHLERLRGALHYSKWTDPRRNDL